MKFQQLAKNQILSKNQIFQFFGPFSVFEISKFSGFLVFHHFMKSQQFSKNIFIKESNVPVLGTSFRDSKFSKNFSKIFSKNSQKSIVDIF